MLHSDDAGVEKNPDFKWGAKIAVGRTNKNVHFYESFTYEGTKYRLFDCAYVLVNGHCETSIGKLVKMFETSEGEKKVRVVWFFRPIDIHNFLGEYEPQWDELFLACGDEKGVHNINAVESIIGKCNVICLSSDPRNPRSATNELRRTNYFFSCTFDTKLKIISEDFPEAIGGIGVGNFFNKIRDKQALKCLNSSVAARSRASLLKSHSESGSMKIRIKVNRDEKPMSITSPPKKGLVRGDHAHHVHLKKSPLVNSNITSRGLEIKTRALDSFLASGSSVDPNPSKQRKLMFNTPKTDDSGPQPGVKKLIENPPLVEKDPSQNIDKNSLYKKLLFENKLKAAVEKGRVLLIENLEPSYTSLEVEDLCRQAFNERVEAKMIRASLMSSPHNGRALVIFQTTKAAEFAMSRLIEGCLMLPNQRPLVGSTKVPVEVGKCRSFAGHFGVVDRSLMSPQKREAISASHCTLPNHIVDPMALEWLALQANSDSTWKELFEDQAKEINIIRGAKTIGKEQCARKSLLLTAQKNLT